MRISSVVILFLVCECVLPQDQYKSLCLWGLVSAEQRERERTECVVVRVRGLCVCALADLASESLSVRVFPSMCGSAQVTVSSQISLSRFKASSL